MSTLFPDFREDRIRVSHAFAQNIGLHVRLGGAGEPLLLLHGYPQTGAMWHRIAPALAERFQVIIPDMRGYGASDKPPGDPDHRAYSKRAMAADMASLMTALGHETFRVVGHDRGGRVTHRLCLDHSARVIKASVLDIIPTRTLFKTASHGVAHAYYHWYFLAQPAPHPETMIGADPVYYLTHKIGGWSGGNTDLFDSDALREYEAAFCDPATIHATCEDYRAGATIDIADDEADLSHRIDCPLQVLWGERGAMHRHYDVLDTWRERARQVSGHAVPSGHFLAEEAPEQTLEALLTFL